MKERTIKVEVLNKTFGVGLMPVAKAKRNRSWLNASDCCGVKLQQDKKCTACQKEVKATECQRKIVKVGKEEYLVKAEDIDNALESMESQEELVIHTFLPKLPENIQDRVDGIDYMAPIEKKEKDYKELQALLKGRFAVGKIVIRSNEYEVIVSVGTDGVIRMQKLVEQTQLYDKPTISMDNVSLSEEIISLECSIIEKKMKSEYNFTEFKDTRSKVEEDIIEQVVLHGEVPQIVVKKVEIQKENDEVARLKALLGE